MENKKLKKDSEFETLSGTKIKIIKYIGGTEYLCEVINKNANYITQISENDIKNPTATS